MKRIGIIAVIFVAILTGWGLHSAYKHLQHRRLAKLDNTHAIVYKHPRHLGHFELFQNNEQRFTENAFRKHWSFVTFGSMNCGLDCEHTLRDLRHIYNEINKTHAKTQLQSVFISLDPWDDSLPALQRYVKQFDPNFIAVTGAPDELFWLRRRVLSLVREKMPSASTSNELNHSMIILLIDPKGRLVAFFDEPVKTQEVVDSLSTLREYFSPLRL